MIFLKMFAVWIATMCEKSQALGSLGCVEL